MGEDERVDSRLMLAGRGSYQTTDNISGEMLEKHEDIHFKLVSLMQTSNGEIVTFSAPSAAAIALKAAIDAADKATELRISLVNKEIKTPFGPATSIEGTNDTALFDYLENSMISVIFSFLALENFSNELLSKHPNKLVEVEVRGRDRKTKVKKPAGDLENKSSTEDKLGKVLPQVLELPTPKGTANWEAFRRLQKNRNDIVHLTSKSSNPRTLKRTEIPQATVFHRLLTQDTFQNATAAVNMIMYFSSGQDIPDWLVEPMSRLKFPPLKINAQK